MYTMIITILGRTDVPVVVHSVAGFETPELAMEASTWYVGSIKDYELTVRTVIVRTA